MPSQGASHLSQKTTLYLDGSDYRRLKRVAARRRVPSAQLVREAVAEYVARHDTVRAPRSIGAFSSGRGNVGERAEELLRGFGRSR
ncbi:MAG: CopG family transcriptional regulator [Vicinamibacterales bacterium]